MIMQGCRIQTAARLVVGAALLVAAGCASPVRMSSPEIPPEIIDMNRIRMEPTDAGRDLEVRYGGEKDKPYLLLNLTFQGAGLNVIEEIKRGRILFHKIVVRDSAGRVLGEEPINFQAVKMTETRVQQTESQVYITPDNERIRLGNDDTAPEVLRRSFNILTYRETDRVPQVIRLREMPDPNSHISVYVVIHMIEPLMKEVCPESQGDVCPGAEYFTFRDIKEELTGLLQQIRQAYEKQNDLPAFKLKNPDEYYTKQMRENIDRLNRSKNTPGSNIRVLDLANQPSAMYANVASFGSRVYFREWKLLSEPTYFRLRITPRTQKKPAATPEKP